MGHDDGGDQELDDEQSDAVGQLQTHVTLLVRMRLGPIVLAAEL